MATTKSLIGSILEEYDSDGVWTELDEAARYVDFDLLLNELRDDFSQHLFPVVLKSLEFNWQFMRPHGTRAFYVMTLDYLEKIEKLTKPAEASIKKEAENGSPEYYPLIQMDLASIEVPAHCDVCRMTITPLLVAVGRVEER